MDLYEPFVWFKMHHLRLSTSLLTSRNFRKNVQRQIKLQDPQRIKFFLKDQIKDIELLNHQ